MTRTGLIILMVCISIGSAPPQPSPTKDSDGYSIIKKIKSPQDLLFPHFPKRYCVPVILSGPIADEMKMALDSLKLETPRYTERFDGKSFHLVLANDNYPAMTRELISGILNPVELIDIVVASVVKYREGEKYAEIVRDSRIEQETTLRNGRKATVIRLTPKGERFAYVYQDVGAFVHESWLTLLTITIDAASNVVNELSTIRYSRTFDAGAADRPKTDSTNAKYLFAYELQDSVLLPQSLTVFFNAAEVLSIEATYRKQGKFYLFDKKEICSSQSGVSSCLKVGYREYQFGGCETTAPVAKGQIKNYSRNLERAAALSTEATEKLRQGQISASVRVLQKLIEQYGDTPQAVEAKKLLNQLPKELQ